MGAVCTARTRKLPQGGRRVEYICSTYHRYGKEYCTTHLIREEVLDDLVYKELLRVKKMACSPYPICRTEKQSV